MTPPPILSLEYRLGLTSELCPHCSQPLPQTEAIPVNGATVVDHYETWMADRRNWKHRKTERIVVICIESNGTAPPKEPLTEPKAEQPT